MILAYVIKLSSKALFVKPLLHKPGDLLDPQRPAKSTAQQFVPVILALGGGGADIPVHVDHTVMCALGSVALS